MRGFALVTALAVAGCWKPYEAQATVVGNGQYSIRANAESSEGAAYQRAAYQRAHKRASQVCPTGYDVVDSGAGATRTYKRVATVDTIEVTIVVRCRTTAEPAPQGQATGSHS